MIFPGEHSSQRGPRWEDPGGRWERRRSGWRLAATCSLACWCQWRQLSVNFLFVRCKLPCSDNGLSPPGWRLVALHACLFGFDWFGLLLKIRFNLNYNWYYKCFKYTPYLLQRTHGNNKDYRRWTKFILKDRLISRKKSERDFFSPSLLELPISTLAKVLEFV